MTRADRAAILLGPDSLQYRSGIHWSRLLFTLGAAMPVVSFALWVMRPRPPMLQLYTSPIISLNDQRVVAKVKIPAGWITTGPKYGTPPGTKRWGTVVLEFSPPPATSRIPAWLLHLFHAVPEAHACLRMYLNNVPLPHPGQVFISEVREVVEGVEVDYARTYLSPGKTEMDYYRSSHSAFEATYRDIYNSYQVLETKASGS